MTFYQLMALLKHSVSNTKSSGATFFKASNGVRYYGCLTAVEREDGSGSSFNLTVRGTRNGDTGTIATYRFHLRTID